MTKDDFREYIAAFNRKDFDGFARFYAPDVHLDVGRFERHGAETIKAFYRDVAMVCDERLELKWIVADEESIAVELDTEFKALTDDPGFIAGPLEKGQSIFITSFIFYALGPQGFRYIKARRITEARHGPSTF